MQTFTVQEATLEAHLAFLSIEKAKSFCRVTWAVEDALFEDLLVTAVALLEEYIRRPILRKKVKTIYPLPRIISDGWFGLLNRSSDPDSIGKQLLLPYGPVDEIVSVEHANSAGDLGLIVASKYNLDSGTGLIGWKDDSPFDGIPSSSDLHVTYYAGYGTPTLENPESSKLRSLRIAVSETILWMYENRGVASGNLPATVRSLLAPLWRSPMNQKYRYAKPV